ncbi:MAG: extracellular solute-binding protein [Gammaproteobacteria bacterium]|nr:extracellular solute-binding protein [Gammaproteobacteria bacterium]
MTSETTVTASLLAILALVAACSGTGNDSAADENIVNVYNWADYIGHDTIERFEAETGIKVNYDTYDSSEIVDVKLLTGNTGYDVVNHSNRFSTRLVPLGIFEKLDMSKLTNLDNLDPEIMAQVDRYEEVRGYYVPYHWGTTGYAWNVEMVRKRLPDHPMDSADVLFDPAIVSKLSDCAVSLLDGTSDLYPMALAYLGRDPGDLNMDNVLAAEAMLGEVRPFVRYFSNTKMTSDLPNREVCVAMSWSGDYAQAEARAKAVGLDIELRYTAPREGTGLWIDGLYILSDARHKENAYKFIDFVLRADVAADIANEIFYANANGASWKLMDPAIRSNPAIYPDDDIWRRVYPTPAIPPRQERTLTRSFARVKSGI